MDNPATDKQTAEALLFIKFLHVIGVPTGTKEEREKIREAYYNIIETETAKKGLAVLQELQKLSCLKRISKAYKENKISPQLRAVLEFAPPNWKTIPGNEGKTWRDIIFDLIRSGKADFSSFKGPQDTGENWLLKYDIADRPVFYITEDLNALADSIPKRKAEVLKGFKKFVSQGTETDAVITLLDLIEAAFNKTKKERYSLTKWGCILLAYKIPDFYLNPLTGEVTAMPPLFEEIRRLSCIESWDYLKDFVTAGRKEIERLKRASEIKEPEPLPGILDKAFTKMLNTPPTNDLMKINTAIVGRGENASQYLSQNLFTKQWEGRINKTEIIYGEEGGSLSTPVFTASTWKLLIIAMILFTGQNSKATDALNLRISGTIDDYLHLTDRAVTISNRKEISKVVKRDLYTLARTSVKYTDKKYSLDMVNLFGRVNLSRGTFIMEFTESFGRYVKNTSFITKYFPMSILKLKEKNPNLITLSVHLAILRNIDNNRIKGRAAISSIKSILTWCPGLPTIEQVRAWGGSPSNKIIKPFEESIMDQLVAQGVLQYWEYCQEKGEPLKKADVDSYKYFEKIYIKYEFTDYPTEAEIETEIPRIEAKKEKARRREERREREQDKAIARNLAKKIIS